MTSELLHANKYPASGKAKTVLVHLSRHLLVAPLSVLLAFLLYLLLYPAGAWAQNFSVQHFTTRNGLRTSAVASVTQTMDGYLWIGTRAGLARFDGSQFKVLTPLNFPGLSSKYIDYVATGPDSTLYVGADDRLCVFSRGHWHTFMTYRAGLASNVMMILPVGRDEAWVGTRFGLLFHYKNGAMKEAGFRFPFDVAISGLATTPDGALWLATALGLFSVSHGKMVRYQPDIPLPARSFYDLSLTSDGSLFAASDAGLFRIRGSHWKQWKKAAGLQSNEVNVLASDARGVLWIGTKAGLARMDGETIRPVSSVSCSVQALFVDVEKSLWIGCNELVGLFRLTTYNFRFVSPPRAFEIASASLAVDRTGAIWIGSHRGLYKYVNGRFWIYTHQDGLPSDWVYNVSVTRGDVVWVATKDGIARIEKGRVISIPRKDPGFAGSLFSVLEGLDGTLWVTSEQGLGRRLPGETALSFEPGFTNLVESMYQDISGAIWVSTDTHGLFRFSGQTKKAYRQTCGIGSDTVYGSVQDDSGAIWAWTFGGLSRIRDNNCANISADAGLPSGEAGSLTYDGAGHLWLRTQSGVAAIDIAEANSVISSHRPLQKTRFVGSEEGLDSALNDLETLNLLVVRSSGQIWIPTVAGIAVLNALCVQRQKGEVRPQVTSLVSDSGEHDIAAPVHLQPDDSHLQFSYRVPSLFGASGRMLRYRLSGFDKTWRDAQDSGDAAYTSIPAGTYTFEVMSRQPFEMWSAASDPVTVIVLAHYYQTWWWYSLVAVAAAGAVWLAYWLRLVVIRRQYAAVFAERDRERSRLARELHDTLSRGMMAIHMQIQLARSLLPAKPDIACTHLDAAVGIVLESAAETRKSITALRSANEEVRPLQDLLNRAVENFKAHCDISLEVDIDPVLPLLKADVKQEIARIVEEALSNVLQHSGAQKVRLSASSSGDLLRIKIADDGHGFDMRQSGPPDFGHFGMQGMRERAQEINANLTTACIPGQGTTVMLEISPDKA